MIDKTSSEGGIIIVLLTYFLNIMNEGLNKIEKEKMAFSKWLKLPRRMETICFGDKRQEDFNTSEKDKMTYCSNNNAIAFVDRDGNYYVAPHSSERVNELENAGYKKTRLGVSLSNGELPTASHLRNKWIEMRKESK